ncbi:MAG TPA: hypothetical protein VEI01_22375 [Terriglobales bacterium]|nr:hypothetical protein [Terriglobales bacterium]
MFPTMLIQLVETHADNLVAGVLRKLKSSDRCGELLQSVPVEELQRRIYEIYSRLGDWLFRKQEFEIEERYIGLGIRRARQGVPLRELLWTINTVKEYLWEYLEQEGLLEQPVDLIGDRELLQSLALFFDHALYYAIVGYESVGLTRMEHAVASTEDHEDLNEPARWVP